MFDIESEAKKVVVNDQDSKVNNRADINKTIVIGAAAIGCCVRFCYYACAVLWYSEGGGPRR